MTTLPMVVGPLTLREHLHLTTAPDAMRGRLDGAEHPSIIARPLLNSPAHDLRARDLLGIRHPFLAPTLDLIASDHERYLVEAEPPGVRLSELIAQCREFDAPLPANIFLNFATQLCNAIEALHGRTGKHSGAPNLLHLALSTESVTITPSGKIVLGLYGLQPSQPGAATAPELHTPGASFTPAADVYALGAALYELLTLQPLLRGPAEAGVILQTREQMPGIERILQRARALIPERRYQRAFVVREDLRGLMANYSFTDIMGQTLDFLLPFMPAPPAPAEAESTLRLQGDLEESLTDLPRTNTETAPPPVLDDELLDEPESMEIPRPAPIKVPRNLALEHELPADRLIPPPPVVPTPDRPDRIAEEISEISRTGPASAVVDPSSTQGFLHGHAPSTQLPPSVEPRVPLPPLDTPRPSLAPAPPEDDDDLNWRPKRRASPLLIGGAVAILATLACVGVGGTLLVSLFPDKPEPALAAATPALAPTPAVEPEPEPVAVAAVEPVVHEVEPTATVAAVSAPRRAEERPVTTARSPSPEPEPEPDALAFLSEPEPEPEVVSVLEVGELDLNRLASLSERGSLQRTDIMALESVDVSESSYQRSRALLLMNAQHQGDASATKRYLDQLLVLPENRYNPVYLTDLARWSVNRGSYAEALEQADLAERHWARLPSDLIFLKKAEIFEIQAASYQGLFYSSDNDLRLLEKSIRHWERYRSHVVRRARTDLVKRADAELEKLREIQQRLEY